MQDCVVQAVDEAVRVAVTRPLGEVASDDGLSAGAVVGALDEGCRRGSLAGTGCSVQPVVVVQEEGTTSAAVRV